jgi:hypothetical protein
MTTAHLERQFEDDVVAHLTGHGWHPGDRTSYRRQLGVDTGERLTFLGATQPEKWERLRAHTRSRIGGRAKGSPGLPRPGTLHRWGTSTCRSSAACCRTGGCCSTT